MTLRRLQNVLDQKQTELAEWDQQESIYPMTPSFIPQPSNVAPADHQKYFRLSINGVDLTITRDGHVIISSAKEIIFDAENISLLAKEELYIGTGEEVRVQSKKVHLNKDGEVGGYDGV